MERFRFFEALHLSVPVDVLRYDPGGAMGVTIFLWRVPSDRQSTEMMTATSRKVKELESRMPEFHTRRMRKEFSSTYGNLSGEKIPPHMLRAMYADIGLDATGDQNAPMSRRLEKAILSDDPDLVLDLRHLNKGRPGDTFSVFFETLDQKVEELRAADERRHGIEHVSKYISVRELIKDVASSCPADTPIPSESTVLFAFAPRNSHARVSKLYKQRVELKFKIQTRQLRSSHQDEHYCAALFRYMRSYSVQYREVCTLLCVDDKAKIDFGEPGLAISSGVRGRRSLVPVNSSLSALDHDVNSKGSLTPSVILQVNIPQNISESFYQGQVSVTLKDSIFQPSTPFRHAAEMIATLQESGTIPPALLLYSDGGPDHRVTYASVKLAMIAVFRSLDLDLLVAARTAPGHSWANPAERVMSVLNLAYQNCSLARAECSSDTEATIRNLNSMEEIRKKASTDQSLKPAWLQSVSGMIEMLSERSERLEIKAVPFKARKPAAERDVLNLEQDTIRFVDPDIVIQKYQKRDLLGKIGYDRYIANHCIERHYMFQICKCDDVNCCQPKRSSVPLPWVPDPEINELDKSHYKTYEDSVGRPTSEKDRPSSCNMTVAAVAQDEQGCKNTFLTAQNVHGIVQCYECSKPRCIYSKGKMSVRESRALKRLLERYDNTCGSLITPDGDALQGKVFVRLQPSCSSPVEFPYYYSGIGKADLCCHCGADQATRNVDLVKKYSCSASLSRVHSEWKTATKTTADKAVNFQFAQS